MASKKKWNKLKNAYLWKTTMKNKNLRLKRLLFFTSAQRKQLKKELKQIIDEKDN